MPCRHIPGQPPHPGLGFLPVPPNFLQCRSCTTGTDLTALGQHLHNKEHEAGTIHGQLSAVVLQLVKLAGTLIQFRSRLTSSPRDVEFLHLYGFQLLVPIEIIGGSASHSWLCTGSASYIFANGMHWLLTGSMNCMYEAYMHTHHMENSSAYNVEN